MTAWQIELLARQEWKRLGRPMKFRLVYLLQALGWSNNAAPPFSPPDAEGKRIRNASVKRALDRWRYYKRVRLYKNRPEHLDSEMVRDCLAAIKRLKDVDVMAGEGEIPPPAPRRTTPTYYPGCFVIGHDGEKTRVWNQKFKDDS